MRICITKKTIESIEKKKKAVYKKHKIAMPTISIAVLMNHKVQLKNVSNTFIMKFNIFIAENMLT